MAGFPGFGAEAVLPPARAFYRSAMPLRVDGATPGSVVPQLPVRVGQVCGPCTGIQGFHTQQCCSFYCETKYPFSCWKGSDCGPSFCQPGSSALVGRFGDVVVHVGDLVPG